MSYVIVVIVSIVIGLYLGVKNADRILSLLGRID